METNTSEPLDEASILFCPDVKTEAPMAGPGQTWKRNCFAVQVASGVEGGVNFTQALYGTQEPVASVLKGEIQMGDPHENESTNTKHRDGTTRSSEESSVMEVERRSRVVWCCLMDQPLSVGAIF